MLPAHQQLSSSASPLLDSEDETVMAELPFVTADARELFEQSQPSQDMEGISGDHLVQHTRTLKQSPSQNHRMLGVRRDLKRSSSPTPPARSGSPAVGHTGTHPDPLKNEFKPQRKKRRRILENRQLGRGKLCRRLKVAKRQLCRSRHQEMVQEQVQGHENPDGAQQLCSPVQLGQGGDHFPATQLLPPDQQPQEEDNVHGVLQRQTVQGGMAPNRGAQQRDQGWEALEVTVKVGPQEVSQRWESPEVTVQVQPQKPSPRWVAPSVTTQVQLQQQGRGPQVMVQVQQQGQGMAGIKITVQLGCDPEKVTCLQDQAETVSTKEEQLTPKQNEGEQAARSEGERELAEVKLEPQRALSQEQDQEEVTEAPKDQNQEESTEVVALQQIQGGDTPDLNGMVTEKQLQDQSQEQKQPEADLPPHKEGQRATEMRQKQGDSQEGPKDQKEDLGQEVSKKRPREAANYFVAIPITNDQILDRIEDVQELIFTKEPLLLKALLPIQTMHITLIIAHLGTEDDIKKAVLALKQSKTKVEGILQGTDFHMTFQGIGQFNDQVLYVDMLEEGKKMLTRITEAVEECFVEMNLDISGSKDFIPHLTFFKLSKAPSLKRRGFTKICSDLYKEFEDSYFGTEVFSRVDLCAMKKKKQESGYYYCECSIHLGSATMEKNKEQEMQTGEGEALSEDLPHSPAKAEIEETAASPKLTSHLVVADDKPSENIAEASTASKEEISEVKGQPEATDGISHAAGEICSKSVLGLLPASSDVLRSVEKEEEEEMRTDGSLQKAEATGHASDQPPSLG